MQNLVIEPNCYFEFPMCQRRTQCEQSKQNLNFLAASVFLGIYQISKTKNCVFNSRTVYSTDITFSSAALLVFATFRCDHAFSAKVLTQDQKQRRKRVIFCQAPTKTLHEMHEPSLCLSGQQHTYGLVTAKSGRTESNSSYSSVDRMLYLNTLKAHLL